MAQWETIEMTRQREIPSLCYHNTVNSIPPLLVPGEDAEDVPKMNPLGKLLRLIGGSSPASTQAAARRRRRRRRRIPPDIATAPATAI
uniref:Uncharacterized protein n=1 Tax=Oryza rufipogon TaxID=4529 RepID=A0A0E0PAF6_ORYRU